MLAILLLRILQEVRNRIYCRPACKHKVLIKTLILLLNFFPVHERTHINQQRFVITTSDICVRTTKLGMRAYADTAVNCRIYACKCGYMDLSRRMFLRKIPINLPHTKCSVKL